RPADHLIEHAEPFVRRQGKMHTAAGAAIKADQLCAQLAGETPLLFAHPLKLVDVRAQFGQMRIQAPLGESPFHALQVMEQGVLLQFQVECRAEGPVRGKHAGRHGRDGLNVLFKNNVARDRPQAMTGGTFDRPKDHYRLMRITLPLIALLLMASCVPSRKYEEANARAKTMQAEADAANA